jgi:hypothetical protein
MSTYTFQIDLSLARFGSLVVSGTGEIHGRGRDPYKWVSRLTPIEREAVLAGCLVVVHRGASTHGGNPPYRKVVYTNGRYTHRVPTADEQKAIEQAISEEEDCVE